MEAPDYNTILHTIGADHSAPGTHPDPKTPHTQNLSGEGDSDRIEGDYRIEGGHRIKDGDRIEGDRIKSVNLKDGDRGGDKDKDISAHRTPHAATIQVIYQA